VPTDPTPAAPALLRRIALIVLGTLVVNTVIAVALVALGLSTPFLPTLVQSQSIGITIAALCWGVTPWVERAQGSARVALPLYAAAIIGGSIAGSLFGRFTTGALFGSPSDEAVSHWLAGASGRRTLLISLMAGALVTLFFYSRHRLRHAQERAEAERWRSIAADRSAAQAQLQALRAQVEPHFLFNTLASVSVLIDRDPAAAKALVDDLSRHLRATLRHARSAGTTLGEELEVTASLLGIMKRRLGDRLHWRFDVPQALHALPIAPMLVQPLVENAVKHGIEPDTAGGTIEVRARRDAAGVLIVEVADTGRGLAADGEPDRREAMAGPPRASRPAGGTDGGTGLANLGERLRAIYGPAARVALHDNQPRGTLARLTLPPMPATPAPATAAGSPS
jgi:signal transduction histidine kinase